MPSESDEKRTTCKCDHLTIFASLMDPFDSNVSQFHQKRRNPNPKSYDNVNH